MGESWNSLANSVQLYLFVDVKVQMIQTANVDECYPKVTVEEGIKEGIPRQNKRFSNNFEFILRKLC